jgi:hypothetical protein
MNSMGAHFNPVSVSIVNSESKEASIVNSESKEAIKTAYEATCNGLYTLYNTAVLCQESGPHLQPCSFCTKVFEQVSDDGGSKCLSDDAARLHYTLEKPSSDRTPSVFSWAKEKFGEECEVQQCGFHPTSKTTF